MRLFVSTLALLLMPVFGFAQTDNPGAPSTETSSANQEDSKNCVYARDVRDVEIINEQTILFRGSHNRFWVNNLAATCVGARKSMGLVLNQHGSQICAQDRIKATDFSSYGVATHCRLGKFQPILATQVALLKTELAERG